MNSNEQNNLSKRRDCYLAVPNMLYEVQVLFSNEQIDVSTKNKMVAIIQSVIKTSALDFSELHNLIRRLQFGSTMPEAFDRLVKMTTFN